MSLIRRVWFIVIFSTVISILASTLVSIFGARNYLEQELKSQAQNAAVSLALTLSHQSKDQATIELFVTALYDSGYFQLVRYTPAGQHQNAAPETKHLGVIERTPVADAEPTGKSPNWFRKIMQLRTMQGDALVSNGWQQAGKVTVIANASHAYDSLWKNTLQHVGWLLLAGAATGLLLSLLVWQVRTPLAHMVQQAERIGKGLFTTIPEPRVLELRSIAQAFNIMSGRIREMFSEQTQRIDQLRDATQRDKATRLPNREFFLNYLAAHLQDPEAAPLGQLLLIKVVDLSLLNKKIGRIATDHFIGQLVIELNAVQASDPSSVAARLNAAEFCIVLPAADTMRAEHAAKKILSRLQTELSSHSEITHDAQRFIKAVWVSYDRIQHPQQNVVDLLRQADSLLIQAESGILPPPLQLAPGTVADTPELWRPRLQQALNENRLQTMVYPTKQFDGRIAHHEILLRLEHEGTIYPAGRFIPMAMRLNMVNALDHKALDLAFQQLQQQPEQAIAVNLAGSTATNPALLVHLGQLLSSQPNSGKRLWLEISEATLGEQLEALQPLSDFCLQHHIHLGVEHFGRRFANLPKLNAVKLSYLKIDRSFIVNLQADSSNYHFVQAIAAVGKSLDIQVFAEGVSTEHEANLLQEAGVSGYCGPYAKE